MMSLTGCPFGDSLLDSSSSLSTCFYLCVSSGSNTSIPYSPADPVFPHDHTLLPILLVFLLTPHDNLPEEGKLETTKQASKAGLYYQS